MKQMEFLAISMKNKQIEIEFVGGGMRNDYDNLPARIQLHTETWSDHL